MLKEPLERYWQMMIVTYAWKEAESSKYILEEELIGLVGRLLGLGHKEREIQSRPRFLA